MTARSVLVALSLVVLTLLAWNLRWVLLVLFGAVVMAVALDVLIQSLQQRTKLERPTALAVVLGLLLLAGAFLGQLLLPELLDQFRQLGRDLPQLVGKLSDLLSSDPRLEQFDESIGSAINLKGLQPLLGFAGGAANTLIQLFPHGSAGDSACTGSHVAPTHAAGRLPTTGQAAVGSAPGRMQACPWGLAQRDDPVSHDGVSTDMGRITRSESTACALECFDLWPAHICSHHWANGSHPPTNRASASAITTIDGVCCGVPSHPPEPRSVPAHTTVASENGQFVANGGVDGAIQPGSPAWITRCAFGSSTGCCAAGANATGCCAANHGSLGIGPALPYGGLRSPS